MMTDTQVFTISLPNMQAAFERMRHDAGWDTTTSYIGGITF
jgi:hypothetical protein